MRGFLVGLAFLTLLTIPGHARQATTYYVNVNHASCAAVPACTDGDPTTACSTSDEPNNGQSESTPFCRAANAATVSITGDTVRIAPGTYRGKVEEGSSGVTWQGTGDHPTDVIITAHMNTAIQGMALSATPGRTNVCQFNPGYRIYNIHELGRLTDLNRTQGAAGSINGSEDDGISAYFAWHVRDSWSSDYFGGAEPSTPTGLLDYVEDVEGSWIQDDDDGGSTWVVYFHPFENRTCAEVGSMEFEKDLDIAFSSTTDNSTVSYITAIGSNAGNAGRLLFGGGKAMTVGGDGSTISDVWTFNADLSVVLTNGLSNFTLQRFVAAGGFSGTNSQNEYAGMVIQDGNVFGRPSAFSWEGPWGTAASRAIFRRITIHDSETWRWGTASCSNLAPSSTVCYTASTDTFGTGLDETSSYTVYHGTHGPTFGGSSPNIGKNYQVENFTTWATSDGLRLTCSTNCVIKNSTIRGAFWGGFLGATATVGSITAHNVVVIGRGTPINCSNTNCAEFVALDYFHVFHTADADIAQGPGGSSDKYTLAELQAAGLGTNGSESAATNANLIAAFNDPSIQVGAGTGGDDYRLVTGSPLINTGSDANCAHTPVSTCDKGAYEFGAASSTGPDPIYVESITPGSESGPGPDPTNNAPAVAAGGDQTLVYPDLDAVLDATVTDDGLPASPGVVTVTWSKVSGPGTATFGDANAVDTTVTFSTIGTYVLQLSATDGSLTTTDTLTITVPGESSGFGGMRNRIRRLLDSFYYN